MNEQKLTITADEFNNAKNIYNDTYNWVQDYYQSDGFKERFKNHNEKLTKKGKTTYTMPKSFTKPKLTINQGKRYTYNGATDTINIDPIQKLSEEIRLPLPFILGHEIGHDVLVSINRANAPKGKVTISTKRPQSYAFSYPILRNKDYKKVVETKDIPVPFRSMPSDEVKVNIARSKKEPWAHYAALDEPYSDLLGLRILMDKEGIFDSKKAGNIFTQEHLDAFKKIYPKHRMYNYYTDAQIIEMMNTVAHNDQQFDISTLYAKIGTKLIKKKY